MRKPSDGQLAIGALIAFALWIFVALPLYYGPRDPNNSAAYNCSAEQEKNYGFWEKARCDPVAYFTAWLVGFTGVLAASTICLWIVTWRASVRQSRDMEASIAVAAKSAEAAKLQADIFFAVEASVFDFAGFKLVEYLYPDGLNGREVNGRDPVKTPPIPEFLRALIAITNLGKAPLRLTGMCVEYGVGKTLPPDPSYLSLNGVNKVVEHGQISEWFMQPAIFQLDQDQRKAIDAGTAYLWVYGFVFYIGLLREPRQLGFAVRWDSQSGVFVLRGPPAYSYDREITD